MAELGTGVELTNLSHMAGGGEDDENKKKRDLENKVIETIQAGDVDDISTITPKHLTECKTNALFMAMKMNFELRQRADRKEPDEEEFNKLANSLDAFTSALLNPLKSKTEDRRAFADSLDDVMDMAIDLEQKKLLAHPILYSLMNDKWLGELRESRKASWRSIERWKWLFLNIWCLFDIVLFPIVFPVLYAIHHVRDKVRANEERGIVFVINATSEVAKSAFGLMKKTIQFVMKRYGIRHASYHVIVRGEDESSSGKVHLNSCFSDLTELMNSVEELKGGKEGIPALHEDLEKADVAFKSNCLEKNSMKKALIVLTDHRTCARNQKENVEKKVEEIMNQPIRMLPIAIGRYVNIKELKKINNGKDVPMFGEYEDPKKVGMKIIHGIDGKSLYDGYLEYFTTPYFIFVRDTLSYMVLLGLHFFICLSPSRISFGGVEWAIFIFFLGRIVMETKQLIRAKLRSKETPTIQKLRIGGAKYTSCENTEVNDGTDNRRGQKNGAVVRTLIKYISDRWNILDTITICIYLATFLLRMATWALSETVTNNRALVIAGYFYGLNTMFLTLRAFGHLMEATKGIGAIQIALFHIIGDVITIFWQFIAVILAFTMAVTKVFMAEKSFVTSHTAVELTCSTSGVFCWWSMLKHFCWSLLGLADLDPLNSVDNPSIIIAYFLYGAFLIMAVILLVNMLIALLSNTYQKVADNSLMEWSYKKAITIQNYCTYDPIPVPFNLISNFISVMKYICRTCRTNQQSTNEERVKALNEVVENLHIAYFATYGYEFPLTEERKMDQVLHETHKSRRMTNQIARRTFSGHDCQQGALPTGEKAWQSFGIRVEGCLLTCEGAEACEVCKDEPNEHHGARYLTPFSKEHPHFEVLLQEIGERRLLGVGVVWEDYGYHLMPGWLDGTVGYHVDDGKIFDSKHPEEGRQIEDAMAYRGDLIGCTVRSDNRGEVSVVFSLNGKQITQEQILIDNPEKKPLYPYIGMAHKGIRVLAKMSSADRYKSLNASSPTDENLQEREMILSTLSGLDEITEDFKEKFSNVDREIVSIHRELDLAGRECFLLKSKISTQFNIITNLVLLKRPPPPSFLQIGSHSLTRRNMKALHESEQERSKMEEMAKSDLITSMKDNVQTLQNLTNESFDSVLSKLKDMKDDGKKHTNELKELKKDLEKKFKNLRDLIEKEFASDNQE